MDGFILGSPEVSISGRENYGNISSRFQMTFHQVKTATFLEKLNGIIIILEFHYANRK